MSEKKRILLVDDANTMRGILKSALMQGGYHDFVEADNGQRAIERLAEHRVDLILCDWDMPKMTGIEFLRHIRADEKLKNLPFILITANAHEKLVREAIAAEVDDYLIKPIRPDMLLRKVKAVFIKTRARNEPPQAGVNLDDAEVVETVTQ